MEIYKRIYKSRKNIIAIVFRFTGPLLLLVKYDIRTNKFTFQHFYNYDVLLPLSKIHYQKISWLELFTLLYFSDINFILEGCRQHFISEIRKYRQSKIIKTRKKCFHIYQLKKARDMISKYM